MKIEIIDTYNLIPDASILMDVISNHPLCERLCDHIKMILIQKSDRESIDYDFCQKKVILNLSDTTSKKENYKYILFHEITHVADKIRTEFRYSDQLKNALPDKGKFLLMELWNIYIDSRLNSYGLFMLGGEDANLYGHIDGEFQQFPFTIEGKLLAHISSLSSAGFKDSELTVRESTGIIRKKIFRMLV